MDDPAGKARTFTFKTDGSGNVQAKLTTKSPQGTTRFCLKVGATKAALPELVERDADRDDLGQGPDDVRGDPDRGRTSRLRPSTSSLSFRARMPSVTLTNGRFDGTGSDGYNGQSGKVKVRSLGTITVKASWGTEPTNYTWSYVDLIDPTNTGVFPGNGTDIDRTDTVTPSRSYGFSLVNRRRGRTGPIPMTLTLAWR